MTIPAPRIPLCDRCVGVSAPEGPPPLSWRTLLIMRCNNLPIAPPPPTGLENGSIASESSRRRRRRRVRGAPSATCDGHVRAVHAELAPRRCAASRLRALITPKAGGRIGDLPASGHGQRRSRGIDTGREVEIDQRSHGIRQQLLVRRQCAVAFDGEVPLANAGRRTSLRTTSGSRPPPRAATPARSPTRAGARLRRRRRRP